MKPPMKRRLQTTAIATVALLCLTGAYGNGCEETQETSTGKTAGHDIIGGTPTGYESWQGAICVHGTCSGTLIDPEVVLTAGHCMTGDADLYQYPNDIRIINGEYCSSQNLLTFSSDVVVHPTWKGLIVSTAADLAMIKLAQPITEIEHYGVRSEDLVYHEEGYIVGYGRSSNSGGFGTHRVGTTRVVSQAGSTETGLDMIELGDGESTTCSGDSGGPFLTEYKGGWVVTGVCSMHTGSECILEANTFHVNTRPFRGWIDEVVEQFTGHGLEKIDDDTDTDTDSDTGTDADTDTDTDSDPGDDDDDDDDDNDNDEVEVEVEVDAGEPDPGPDDSGCGCLAVGDGPMRSSGRSIGKTFLGIAKLFL